MEEGCAVGEDTAWGRRVGCMESEHVEWDVPCKTTGARTEKACGGREKTEVREKTAGRKITDQGEKDTKTNCSSVL